MVSSISPGIVLVVVFAFIGAQATRLVAPRTTPYIVNVLLAAIGIVAAELVVYAIHRGGPTIGVLHPVVDLIGVAGAEVCGMILWPDRPARIEADD